jgi:GT2 family glycosyltransferase
MQPEVIVVDNASTDHSAELVRREFPQVNLIENERNLFFTRANNQAVRVSKGRYILILNSDTWLPEGLLRKIVEFMDTHPQAGAAGCALLNPNGTLQQGGWKFHTLGSVVANRRVVRWIFPNARLLKNHFRNDWDVYNTQRMDVISDACAIIRREAITGIEMSNSGLYDERYLLYFTEDDLCMRLRRAGWEAWYIADARVVHLHKQSTRKIFQVKMWWIYMRDVLRYFGKYESPLSVALIAGVLTLDLAIKAIFLFPSDLRLLLAGRHRAGSDE